MGRSHSFKFLNDGLNQELIGLLKKAGIEHSIDKDGAIRYSPGDEEVVENELIASIRGSVFPSWQVLTCPTDWTARYKDHMHRHGIPFQEEWSDGERWFLIPRKYRPHSWKLGGARNKERLEPQRSK